MAARTPKQRKQSELAWKLRMIRGAQGTLYPREKSLSTKSTSLLNSVCIDLKAIETLILDELRNIK